MPPPETVVYARGPFCHSYAAPHPPLARSRQERWSIHEDGQEIGRLYEDPTALRPENAWFWSIIVMGPPRHRTKTDGRAPTLEDAKAQFAAAWEAFKRAAVAVIWL